MADRSAFLCGMDVIMGVSLLVTTLPSGKVFCLRAPGASILVVFLLAREASRLASVDATHGHVLILRSFSVFPWLLEKGQ